MFYFDGGDLGSWWESMRDAVAAQAETDVDDVSNQDIRKYIRENKVRTPGGIRREIGRRFSNRKGLVKTPKACSTIIEAQAAGPEQRLALAIVDAITPIAAQSKRYRTAHFGNSANQEVGRAIRAMIPNPGLILEADGDGITEELLNDMYEIAVQESGFGPTIAMALTAKNVKDLLAHLNSTTMAVSQIRAAYASYQAEVEA